jgi:hypothetical protein
MHYQQGWIGAYFEPMMTYCRYIILHPLGWRDKHHVAHRSAAKEELASLDAWHSMQTQLSCD